MITLYLSNLSSTRRSHLEPNYQIPDKLELNNYPKVIPVKYLGELTLRTWSSKATCKSITCIVAQDQKATLCFQKQEPDSFFQFGENQEFKGEMINRMEKY